MSSIVNNNEQYRKQKCSGSDREIV